MVTAMTMALFLDMFRSAKMTAAQMRVSSIDIHPFIAMYCLKNDGGWLNLWSRE